MEPKFQSSFIPKGPLATTGTVTKVSATSDRSILGTLAVFVFVFSILTAGGVLGYEWYLKGSIAQMGSNLEQARATLDKEAIETISSLNVRLNSTRQLLNQHTVLSPLFDYLEDNTLRTVRFTRFGFGSDTRGLTLTMRGQARGYSALALQSQILNDSDYLKNVAFSELSLDDRGNVTFSVEADLESSLISFKRIAGEADQAQTPVPVPVPVPTPVPASARSGTTTSATSSPRTTP